MEIFETNVGDYSHFANPQMGMPRFHQFSKGGIQISLMKIKKPPIMFCYGPQIIVLLLCKYLYVNMLQIYFTRACIITTKCNMP